MKVHDFFEKQLQQWPVTAVRYKELAEVETRMFDFEGFKIQVVYNPGRVRSSTAKVDAQSIKERPCFLCSKNRPSQQIELSILDYTYLVNPFPIAHPHFTIAHTQHIEQLLEPHLVEMLDILEFDSQYAVFYNGAECGASAPDHLHFQSVLPSALPVIEDAKQVEHETLIDHKEFHISTLKNYLRTVLIVESETKEGIIGGIQRILKSYQHSSKEASVNVILHKLSNQYYAYVFPRKQLRPWQYFETGEKRLLISPGTIEMAGVLITPYAEDFKRLNKEDIQSIYEQVSAPVPKELINHGK